MKYPFLFFDADNTIFDFDQAEAMALERALLRHGIEFQAGWLELYRKINVAIWKAYESGELKTDEVKRKRFSELVEQLELSIDSEQLSQEYLDELSRCAPLLDSAESVLDQLHRRGHRMLILTNGLAEVQHGRFDDSPVRKFFEALVISGEVGAAKPDGKIFSFAWEVFGCPPKEQVLMIGDNLASDIQGGHQFQIATCWMNLRDENIPASVEPTHAIKNLGELLHLV